MYAGALLISHAIDYTNSSLCWLLMIWMECICAFSILVHVKYGLCNAQCALKSRKWRRSNFSLMFQPGSRIYGYKTIFCILCRLELENYTENSWLKQKVMMWGDGKIKRIIRGKKSKWQKNVFLNNKARISKGKKT